MAQDFNDTTTIPVSRLSANQSYSFSLKLSDEARAEMAKTLDLLALKKPSLIGTLKPHGADDWLLEARLGATVQQACVITLAPVSARIEERVERLFVRQMPNFDDLEEDAEVEMPEDDRAEPLENTINLADVFGEALSLALPPYPRAEGANLTEAVFTEDGKTPLTDQDTKPFAGLAALKAKLEDRES
ncbi:YceD family protein [Lentibacter sp.]|uniref:YceD family protein n=1 Tax=Lentibacter sp. TaxID=2024994 RepID=UPI003F6A0FE9